MEENSIIDNNIQLQFI